MAARENRILLSRFTTVGSRGQASTALRGVHLAALGPEPRYPVYDLAGAKLMARRKPSVFWPQWSVRLTGAQHTQRALRPALAAALLWVGTGLTVSEGSTPNSSRPASRESTISCVGGRAPLRRNSLPVSEFRWRA